MLPKLWSLSLLVIVILSEIAWARIQILELGKEVDTQLLKKKTKAASYLFYIATPRRKVKVSKGGCTPSQVAQISTFVSESAELADAALKAIDSYSTNLVAQETLLSLFGVRPNSDKTAPDATSQDALDQIEEWITGVQTFLNGKRLEEKPEPKYRAPIIFCSDKWAVLKKPTDTAVNNKNKPVTKKLTNGKTVKVPIKDIEAYRPFLKQARGPSGRKYQTFPYLINVDPNSGYEYMFESNYGGKGFCSLKVDAGTNTDIIPNVITLCPSAFTTLQPDLDTKAPTVGDNIGDIMGRSTILFHELFHLVQGQTVSFDWADTWQQCGQYAKKSNAKAATSPECLTLFAHAMWLHNKYPQYAFSDGTCKEI